ncbi:S-layer family protein [Nostoc sp. CHAB 5836]|uniref:two-partner secretion domain-containing protein n=1 Tax=Nostoc sp. CHAB 5836 TaxID=2780404 RepID=UPI001E2865BC|nr:S-layer family protein [Nostoc sp. CHAB 5836]MCC5614771.1 S-layer family protein [Nostoc sp. CHAB 5836]
MSNRWGWFIGIAIASASVWSANCALAQELKPIPDNTLGAESSLVTPFTPDSPVDVIDGGAQRGTNLFHSFLEFNVAEGRRAYFYSRSADIQNIFARVTGSKPSKILGTIGTFGNSNPNLFLINPNGIIFGRNASLNIGGSFVATTASAIAFGNQGFFSASNPESSSSLLTVNPSALLFNQIKTASIENNSVGLRVPDGNSLLLVGGDIKMDGGGLFASGGRVELGGLAGAGTVGLNEDGNNLSLSFTDSVERSDVFLSNGARVDVIANDGGSIAVNARNIEMTGSFLIAGIDRGLGFDNSKAGNIEVNATVAINVNNGSSIFNLMLAEANGQGGDVNISAKTLQVEDQAQVSTAIFGSGKGGNLTVDAQDVQLIGESADGQVRTGLFASAVRNSTGDAGDVTIKTNTLLVRDGAQVSASTSGVGKGGNLTVEAQDVQLIGESADGEAASSLGTSAQENSTGNAGNLTIKTNTLLVRDGAQVNASTGGGGKGGNLMVDAKDVQLIGRKADDQVSTGLFAASALNSTGNAGDLTIKTNTLLVRDGAQVLSNTAGSGKGGNLTVDAQDVQLIGRSAGQVGSGLFADAQLNSGDAGDLTIQTNTLLVRDGAQVGAGTFGSGKGGSLTVDAQDVQLIGKSADNQFPSGLRASAEPNSTGDASNLTIQTNTLLVKDGAQVGTGTFGTGKGGNLTVDAQDVQLIGTSADGQSISGLFASAQPDSTANAGDLTIKTNTLLVRDGAQVGASTFGGGKGGSLTVDAQDVQIIGRGSALGASAQPDSTGDAGDLMIKTNTLLVRDGAAITVQSLGTGTAGIMTLNSPSIRLDNNALLIGNTQSAGIEPNKEQATININSENLIMSRNSNIFTNATGENVIGGNININTDFLVGFENSDIRADSANFRGGNVRINAQGIFGIQFRDIASNKTSDITATGVSSEFSGNVEINTPDVDPNSGLIELPTIAVDTEVAQTCQAGGTIAESKFMITGRGGLPPNPGDALSTDAVQVDLVTLNPKGDRRDRPYFPTKTTTPAPERIIEATDLVLNEKGEVVLTANVPTTPHSPWFNSASCRAS